MSKNQAQKEIADALISDPTIFMYDEIYDDIKNKPKTSARQIVAIGKQTGSQYRIKQQPLKPRYIDSMKRSTFRREREHQLVTERLNLKKTKLTQNQQNVFVTGSYLKEQQQRRKIEEQMRREQQYDKEHTVGNKDRDMIAFSRYLLQSEKGKPTQATETKDKNKERQKIKQPIISKKYQYQQPVKKQPIKNLQKQQKQKDKLEPKHNSIFSQTLVKQLQKQIEREEKPEPPALSPLDLFLTPIFDSTKQSQSSKPIKFYSQKAHKLKQSNPNKK